MEEREGPGERIKAHVQPRIERVEAMYEGHGRLFKAAWVALGGVVVLAGLAMTVLPGPAVVLIPVGLAMLGAAFEWARRLVRVSVDVGASSAELVARASGATKLLGAIAVLCVVGAVVALVVMQ